MVVEIWLDRQQARLGERMFGLARVTNNGETAPVWETNICGHGPAPITVTKASDLPAGKAWPGLAADFKRAVLVEGGFSSQGRAIVGEFWEASHFDAPIPIGCPAYSQERPFLPGETSQMLLAWDAVPREGQVLTSGTASVEATFTSSAGRVTAETSLELQATDSAEQRTIVDYIDIALTVPEFNDWLNARPRASWVNTNVSFWPNDDGEYPPRSEYAGVTNGAVDIGLFRSHGDRDEYGAVIIDLGSGRVVGTRFE
jgi:hypothetical protein